MTASDAAAPDGGGVLVRDVVVRIGRDLALDRVTLHARAGSVTAVVGGDGAGKTTLLRALVGRVPIHSGTVRTPARERIGYLPASEGSWRGLTVMQNLQFVGGSYGMPIPDVARRAAELLGSTGLAPFGDRPASQLSGGMRRKLGVCMAMLHDPELLVLDEPSTGVDPVSRVDLWHLAARAAARGTTVVMSTTYLDEAARARHVVVLDQGRALASGSPDRIVADVPGVITREAAAVRPEWAWRRGRTFRELWLDATPPATAATIAPDLEDAVIARALAGSGGSDGVAGSGPVRGGVPG